MMEQKQQAPLLDPSALPSSEALAYLGDAAYSLYVRELLVRHGTSHAKDLNRLSLLYVTAERQAALFQSLSERLTETEYGIYRRAHNHKGLKTPKHASYADYRMATGLEALIGALYYVGDTARIHDLLDETLQAWLAEENTEH